MPESSSSLVVHQALVARSPLVRSPVLANQGRADDPLAAALRHKLRVIATARKPEVLEELKQQGAATVQLDVTQSEEELRKFAEEAVGI